MKRFLIACINFYRKRISPLKPGKCKFLPTCSEYAIEAISYHGAFKGFFKSLWRLLRCNPFSKGGYDPPY